MGVGRGAGEPPEAAWSLLGKHGSRLQYMSKPARHAALVRIISVFNNRKYFGVLQLLQRMLSRARAKLKEAKTEAERLANMAMQQNISVAQVAFCLYASIPKGHAELKLKKSCLIHDQSSPSLTVQRPFWRDAMAASLFYLFGLSTFMMPERFYGAHGINTLSCHTIENLWHRDLKVTMNSWISRK